jgi:hypothetical protein
LVTSTLESCGYPGQTGNLLISANVKTGDQTVSGFVPTIPYQVVAR